MFPAPPIPNDLRRSLGLWSRALSILVSVLVGDDMGSSDFVEPDSEGMQDGEEGD